LSSILNGTSRRDSLDFTYFRVSKEMIYSLAVLNVVSCAVATLDHTKMIEQVVEKAHAFIDSPVRQSLMLKLKGYRPNAELMVQEDYLQYMSTILHVTPYPPGWVVDPLDDFLASISKDLPSTPIGSATAAEVTDFKHIVLGAITFASELGFVSSGKYRDAYYPMLLQDALREGGTTVGWRTSPSDWRSSWARAQMTAMPWWRRCGRRRWN